MTQEEKALAYDKALEKARIWKEKSGMPSNKQGILDDIFPELKESEEEKTKRMLNIITYKMSQHQPDIFTGEENEWFDAWLEKQDQVIDTDELAKGVLSDVANEIMQFLDANTTEGNMCLSNMECEDLENAVKDADWLKVYRYMKKKLERQGEQTFASNEEWCDFVRYFVKERTDHHTLIPSDDDIRKWGDIILTHARKVLGTQGEQKPADKVKPKFHEGEWVVDKRGIVEQIVRVGSKSYKTNYNSEFGFNLQDNYHLWTIADAKDGDVLHSRGFHSECIFIFDKIDNWKFDEPNGDRAVATSHCCITIFADNIEFGVQGPDCIEVNSVKPATEFARNLLFAKMKEAGYEWDAEKKELKKSDKQQDYNGLSEFEKAIHRGFLCAGIDKVSVSIIRETAEDCLAQIEQKPTEDIDAEKASEEYRNYRMSCGITDPMMLDEIESAYYEGATRQKPAEWSEEDEKMFDNIYESLICLQADYNMKSNLELVTEVDKEITWLKSIKERGILQHKQETIKGE